jgi:hypothetical protein
MDSIRPSSAARLRCALSAALASILLITNVAAEGPRSRPVALTVDTDPAGARLFVDGRYAGQTPAELADLASGAHRVRLEKPGYLENARIVDVDGKRPARLRVTMTPIRGAAEQVVSGASSGSLTSNKWFWIGVAGAAGGAGAALALKGKENLAPVIGSVRVEPPSGLQGATDIAFTAVGASDSEGDPLTYNWEFGDGTSGSGATVTHRFSTAGTFTATLNVTDGKHTVSARGSVTIVSLTGTWRGNNAAYTVTITHAGSALSVVWDDVTGGLSRRWSGSGSVSSARNMSAVLNPVQNAGVNLSLSGTLDSAGNTITGSVNGFVTPNFPLDVRRQ